ncbi:hypothetical protein ACJW31_08G159600 [Castanea mollissima]
MISMIASQCLNFIREPAWHMSTMRRTIIIATHWLKLISHSAGYMIKIRYILVGLVYHCPISSFSISILRRCGTDIILRLLRFAGFVAFTFPINLTQNPFIQLDDTKFNDS